MDVQSIGLSMIRAGMLTLSSLSLQSPGLVPDLIPFVIEQLDCKVDVARCARLAKAWLFPARSKLYASLKLGKDASPRRLTFTMQRFTHLQSYVLSAKFGIDSYSHLDIYGMSCLDERNRSRRCRVGHAGSDQPGRHRSRQLDPPRSQRAC